MTSTAPSPKGGRRIVDNGTIRTFHKPGPPERRRYMRSPTKKILVDRLDRALRKRGVELKRSAVIEIMAQAFGIPNSDHLEKAFQDGEIDPPLAMSRTPGNGPLAWLLDPIAGSVFAYDPDAVPTTSSPMILSPYGNLLRLPAPVTTNTGHDHVSGPERIRGLDHRTMGLPPQEAEPWINGMDDDNRPFQQVGTGREIVRLDKGSTIDRVEGLEDYGLQRFEDLTELDVDLNPFVSLTGRGASLVDGRVNLTFSHSIETNHAYAMGAAIAEMQSLAYDCAERLVQADCVLRWTEDRYFGNLDVELYVPEHAIAHLADDGELADAILEALGAPDFSGKHSLKRLEPVPETRATTQTIGGIGAFPTARESVPDAKGVHWSEVEAAKRHRIGSVSTDAKDRDPRVSVLHDFLIAFVPLSDRLGDGFSMNTISTVDGIPHLEVVYAVPCGQGLATRSEAASEIDRMHRALVDLVEPTGAVMYRSNRRSGPILSIHFPFETVSRSTGVDGWTRAVRSVLLNTRREVPERLDISGWLREIRD